MSWKDFLRKYWYVFVILIIAYIVFPKKCSIEPPCSGYSCLCLGIENKVRGELIDPNREELVEALKDLCGPNMTTGHCDVSKYYKTIHYCYGVCTPWCVQGFC